MDGTGRGEGWSTNIPILTTEKNSHIIYFTIFFLLLHPLLSIPYIAMYNTGGPSNARTMLDLPKNGIAGSNPALCIDEYLSFAVFCSSVEALL
jgi:hypothetical protein